MSEETKCQRCGVVGHRDAADFCGWCGAMLRQEDRERRTFWVITDEHRVVQAEGLSCAPNNPGYWWFPKLGSSMAEGFHAFAERAPAADRALRTIDARIEQLTETRKSLVRE